MARGWGGGPPDIKGTLGTLLKTTLIQIASLRDAARQELENRREWAGGLLLPRKRTEVLAGLGEIIYELFRAGELDLEDFPEVRRAIEELQAIDADLDAARSAAGAEPARRDEIPVWRPNLDDVPEAPEPEAPAPVEAPRRRAARGGAGQIAFVDEEPEDEDLSEYMHEDDVPEPKDEP